VDSDNPAVGVKAVATETELQIVIKANKALLKGEAKVSWQYETAAGVIGGCKNLRVVFE
jgi:hypothetical protein